MFGPDFYPTPGRIAARMLSMISKDAVYFLEPSAGKGDLAKAILGFGRAGSYSRHQSSRHHVDVIESNPDLVAALRRHDELHIVGFDWLTYGGVSYYDAIVMNPPFSQGATHLLRAWDFLHAGEIVCLLNQDTIDNPCTQERKRLIEIIQQHGKVEALDSCFHDADRPTDVRVALIYLKKTAEEDLLNLWHTSDTEKPINDDIGSPEALPALKDTLGNMEHYYHQALTEMFKAFSHIRKSTLFMQALDIDIRGHRERDDLGTILKLAQGNITAARAEFSRALRRAAWTHVFDQMEFTKWLDSVQTDVLMRDMERNSSIAFTATNIKGTLTNIFLQRKQLFEQSVWNVFQALTRHFKGNATGDIGSGDGRSGWKSNDSYKVNLKLVFPYGCRYSYGGFDIYSTREAGTIYSDLDRILAVLDGTKFEEIHTVCRALESSFRSYRGQPRACESTYFDIRYFKKGTVHLKWKRKDLWQAFNTTAAAGRQWIGEQTQEDSAA